MHGPMNIKLSKFIGLAFSQGLPCCKGVRKIVIFIKAV
jgi:hypothetical protein